MNEIKISNQIWMCSNLDVDHYRNGDLIPQVTDDAEWSALPTGAWCYYDNTPKNGGKFGKLYNWYAVNDSRGLAPDGWHIPSKEEFYELLDAAETDNFNVLFGGFRSDGGVFKDLGDLGGSVGFFWSASPLKSSSAWIMYLYLDLDSGNCYASLINGGYAGGFYVRCIKD